MMSMQEVAPARAQVRAAEVPNFDSIFRPKRQAYPAHCNCHPTPPTCAPGPAGDAGLPGNDAQYVFFTQLYFICGIDILQLET